VKDDRLFYRNVDTISETAKCRRTNDTGSNWMNGKHLWPRLLYTVAAVIGGIIGGMLADTARHSISPAVAQTPANGQIISAKEFRLVAEDGRVEARLFLDPYVPKLVLYNPRGDKGVTLENGGLRLASWDEAQQQGQVILRAETQGGSLGIGRTDTAPQIDLSVSQFFGARLDLSSGEDHREVQLSAQSAGLSVLLWDRNAEPRMGLELDNHDNPGVYLYDKKGQARSSLALEEAENPDLSLLDAQKRIRADLELDGDGSPRLTLSDAKQARAVLGSSYLKNTTTGSTEHRSPSSLVLFREDGKLLWSTP
jgi:hypothetical protein